MTAYQDLEKRFKRLSDIRGAEGVLHWDSATMMPPGGAEARGEQLATLSVIAHQAITDPALEALLDEAEGRAGNLDGWQSANLREMRRAWRHANAVGGDLVEALTREGTACEMAWRGARADDDFAALVPKLASLLGLVREKAAAKAAVFGCSAYDALLDAYDPETSSADIDTIFDDVRAFLPGLIAEVTERQAQAPPPLPLDGAITEEAQRALGETMMVQVGFDTNFGRLDVSHHPFTVGVPDDIRITTRYKDGDFTESLMAVLHETGHALYERGLPKDWRGQPVGEARGMTLHESQSLLMEMQASRSDAFLTFAAPVIRKAFGGTGPAWSEDNLRRIYRKVEPGLIRVEADEVTYPAHILLRYDLERAMLADDLQVADLPGAWAEGVKKWLGLDVPDDRDGCMQDIHWYGGDFGYFPTYTLGALAAAQLFAAATGDGPAILSAIGKGDFAPLLAWLRASVHGWGSKLSTQEILIRATGEPLGTAAFTRHIRARYLS